MNADAIYDLIVKNVLEVLPYLSDHAFQRTDSLADLGANSMDRSEILMMTLEDLDLNVPAVDFHGTNSIGALADRLHDKLAVRT